MVARMVAAAAAVACLAFLGLGSLPPVRAAIKSSFLIAPPFDKHDHRGSRIIPYWDKSGATNIMQSFVRVSGICAYVCLMVSSALRLCVFTLSSRRVVAILSLYGALR